ncbi:MAG TPA: glutathionylspermidine synthase family protein [Campylobacterales bacterium]|nr:glutathionylspermidine synthase family protein [Campylobacterales bacterium]
MPKLINVQPLPKEALEEIGFYWHTDVDNSDYIADSMIEVSEAEAEAYYKAANEIYDMFVEAGEYVIKNNLFHEIGVPFNLVEAIKLSWESDVHWHLYGRFDFAGGIDGKPIKLLEFNADTPTAVFETAIIQWALARQNGFNEASQFNNLFEALKANFKRVVTLGEEPEEFERIYDGWRILFSAVRGSKEEENTVKFLQQTAHEAGWTTGFTYMDEVGFDQDHGVFDENGDKYEFWFKLYPWEEIAINEGALLEQLTNMIKNQTSIFINPPYAAMFHSKGMLPILKQLFPNSPYLLDASFEPLKGKSYVEKKCFSREGENVKIVDVNGAIVAQKDGIYGASKSVYQEYVELPSDAVGAHYQAGVFYAYEGAGLGFRKGGKILDNMSKFVGHVMVGES